MAAMDGTMTLGAERNQVLFCIVASTAAKRLMMDLQVGYD